MKKVIWLKTARVSGHNPDNTAKVERITVKLEDGDNFDKFIKYAQLKGYLKKPEDPSLPNEEPRIEKVMENQSGKWVNIDPSPWIEKLNKAMVFVQNDARTDFKLLSEKQAKELDQVKANYNSLEERLKALENQEEPKKVGRPKAN